MMCQEETNNKVLKDKEKTTKSLQQSRGAAFMTTTSTTTSTTTTNNGKQKQWKGLAGSVLLLLCVTATTRQVLLGGKILFTPLFTPPQASDAYVLPTYLFRELDEPVEQEQATAKIERRENTEQLLQDKTTKAEGTAPKAETLGEKPLGNIISSEGSHQTETEERTLAENAASTTTTTTTTTLKSSPMKNPVVVDTTTNNNTFSGTRVTHFKHDMKLYENVCIIHQDGQKINFRSYVKDADPQKAKQRALEQSVIVYRSAYGIEEPVPHPLEQWFVDSQSDGGIFEEETIWTFELYRNPGHCFSDMMLPLVLDQYQRGGSKGGETEEEKSPFYDYFLRGRPRKFWDDNTNPSWCYTMFEAAGLLGSLEDRLVPMKESTKCFRKLYVPHVTGFRYPHNKVEDPEHLDVFKRIANVDRFMHPRDYEIDFPRAAMTQLRTNVARYFNLTTEPWPEEKDDNNKKKNILLHIRGKKQRRQLFNALAFKEALEKQLHVTVTILSDAWSGKGVSEQLEVYNSQQYVISTHGAHLSNALVARPGTKFIELYCCIDEDALPDPLLTERTETTPYEKWYGFSALGWFATPFRRMGYEWYESGQTHCTNEHDRYKNDKYRRGYDMYVDVNSTVALVKTRFQVEPRA